MIEVALARVPNQSLSIRLENNLYNLILKETNGCMSATVIRNNITLLSNIRLVAGTPMIPYEYLEAGNFVLTTLDDDLPDWNQFGISQSLIYVSEAELGEIRAGT